MKGRLWLLGPVLAGVTACATEGNAPSPPAQPALYPPAVFAHRVSTADLTVYWNCEQPEPGAVRVDGVVQNTGGRSVEYAQIEIVSVDARERTIASVRSGVRDVILQTNQISPFQLGLRIVGAEARIDLYYEYRARPHFGLGGFQGFPEHFRARDVCSDTQHRVPKPQ